MTEFVHGHVYRSCSVNSHACTNSVYQALLSPPLESGNEAILEVASDGQKDQVGVDSSSVFLRIAVFQLSSTYSTWSE